MVSVSNLSFLLLAVIMANGIACAFNLLYACYYFNKSESRGDKCNKSITTTVASPPSTSTVASSLSTPTTKPTEQEEKKEGNKKEDGNKKEESNQEKRRSVLFPISNTFLTPVTVGVVADEDLICESVSIAKRWSVTAASCIDVIENIGRKAYLTSGNIDWRYGDKHDIEDMVKHEKFDGCGSANDIGLIKVVQPFNIENGLKLNKQFNYEPGLPVEMYGWSFYKNAENDNFYTIGNYECKYLLPNNSVINDNVVCTNVCQFNLGSPLISEAYLIGIATKMNANCAKENMPGVYLRISEFVDWIYLQVYKH